ncbi:hypothetical protein Lesp02_09350 [Lentzea sp. NBRC 105346]|nr:hypothetical protein Lesp02_09350 [Lentzea sp. NBRC 105346]
MHRGAVAAPWFVDDLRPERRRHLGRTVGGAVVDHDRPITCGQRREDLGEGSRLVETGKYDVNIVHTKTR